MAHPKRKISRTRRDKRRYSQKRTRQNYLAICPTTGEAHLPHRAFWHEGKLYYKGNVVMEKEVLA